MTRFPSPSFPRLAALLAIVTLLPALDAPASSQQSAKPMAEVDGDKITESEVMERAADQMAQVEAQLEQCRIEAEKNRHTVVEQTVEVLVRERLVEAAAGKAGMDKEEWLQAEIAKREAALTKEEVDDFFERNKNRLGQFNRAQVEPQVRKYLASQAVYDSLKADSEISYLVDPYRLEVEPLGPSRGAEDAPITIVEFSDFQCPYCKQVVPTLEQALEKYDGKIRLVFRQFPLTGIHPQAFKAAEAALCANDQEKFWDLHDLMFEEQSTLEVAELLDKAKRLGLDEDQFSTCLNSGRYANLVREDLEAGSAVGVTGTPALFVNGRPLSGAVNLEQLSEVIDDELRRHEG